METSVLGLPDFLADACEIGSEHSTSAEDLYKVYCDWTKARETFTYSGHKFLIMLSKQAPRLIQPSGEVVRGLRIKPGFSVSDLTPLAQPHSKRARELAGLKLVKAARAHYQTENIEIDENALISRVPGNPDPGAWVAAWVWVPDDMERQNWSRSSCRNEQKAKKQVSQEFPDNSRCMAEEDWL